MRGIRKQSSDTQSSSQPKEKRRLDTKQKKGMLIGGGIFLVAVIALILVKNLTGGGGADGENVLYADSVGMITGTGLGTQNRFTGVVEAQDTLKLTLADNQKVKQIFVEKGQEVEPCITLLEGDAEEILGTLSGPYDFIFMDAAKGQYMHWLPQILRLLPSGGVLLSDNVLQDGDIVESRYAVERRNRTIHTRMRDYLYELTHMKEFETSVIPIGDGVALSVKR